MPVSSGKPVPLGRGVGPGLALESALAPYADSLEFVKGDDWVREKRPNKFRFGFGAASGNGGLGLLPFGSGSVGATITRYFVCLSSGESPRGMNV